MSFNSEESQTYTVSQIALILNLNPRTAYNFCQKTTEFKVHKIGRLVRINKASFDNWFKGQKGN